MAVVKDLDILFLDIRMPDMDGYEVGRKIREMDVDCMIVMASFDTQNFSQAFGISAFDYLVKPYEQRELERILKRGLTSLQYMKTMQVYRNRVMYELYLKDIRYINSVDSSVEVVTKSGVFRKETSLNELEKILDGSCFFRINRTCIVNMKWIQEHEDGNVIMDGCKMQISMRRRKEFMLRYMQFMCR